jgi:membrane fusion protein, multidrug efflux system
MKEEKHISLCTGFIYLLFVMAFLFVDCSGKKSMTMPPVPVLVAQAVVQSVPLTLQAVGSVEPIESVAVKAQVGGVIVQVNFSEGQDVRSGQRLFQIDPRPFQVALQSANAQLAKDHAQWHNAEIQAKRYSDLIKKEYVTQEQFDAIQTQTEMFKSAVQVDQAAVEQAKLNLSWASLVAPISGRTGSLLIKRGNVVRANDAALVVINQMRPIRVNFAIPGTQLPLVQKYAAKGTLAVHVRPSRNGDSLEVKGRLSFFDNAVDPGTGTVTLKAEFSNEEGELWPGQFVDTELVLTVQPDALTVPASAVVTGQAGSFVYLVTKEKTVEKRTVIASRSQKNIVVIETGLKAGDMVVTDGQMRLVPGAKIDVRSGLSAQGRTR